MGQEVEEFVVVRTKGILPGRAAMPAVGAHIIQIS
jgi:hypothetical protein